MLLCVTGLGSHLVSVAQLSYTTHAYLNISVFLGGLSLYLNHLIASRVRNFDWTFGTLPFGLFGSNLDTMDLEAYPRTYSGHF